MSWQDGVNLVEVRPQMGKQGSKLGGGVGVGTQRDGI